MIKKISILLIAMALVLAFAACGNDKTTSETSTTSSAASEAVSSVVSEAVSEAVSSEVVSEEVSEADVSGIVDGVYTGTGYTVSVPEGFTLTLEQDGAAMFSDTSGSQFNIVVSPNTTKVETMTQKQVETAFSAVLGDTKIQNFEEITVDGKKGVSFMFSIEAGTVKVNSYNAMIFNGDDMIVVTLAAADDLSASFEEILSSITLG